MEISKLSSLNSYFKEAKSDHIKFECDCHDCGKTFNILADIDDDKKIIIEGGALYILPHGTWAKCDKCFEQDPELHNYQPCEVFSRVVGFLTPTKQWNKGKQSEWKMRKEYNVPESL